MGGKSTKHRQDLLTDKNNLANGAKGEKKKLKVETSARSKTRKENVVHNITKNQSRLTRKEKEDKKCMVPNVIDNQYKKKINIEIPNIDDNSTCDDPIWVKRNSWKSDHSFNTALSLTTQNGENNVNGDLNLNPQYELPIENESRNSTKTKGKHTVPVASLIKSDGVDHTENKTSLEFSKENSRDSLKHGIKEPSLSIAKDEIEPSTFPRNRKRKSIAYSNDGRLKSFNSYTGLLESQHKQSLAKQGFCYSSEDTKLLRVQCVSCESTHFPNPLEDPKKLEHKPNCWFSEDGIQSKENRNMKYNEMKQVSEANLEENLTTKDNCEDTLLTRRLESHLSKSIKIEQNDIASFAKSNILIDSLSTSNSFRYFDPMSMTNYSNDEAKRDCFPRKPVIRKGMGTIIDRPRQNVNAENELDLPDVVTWEGSVTVHLRNSCVPDSIMTSIKYALTQRPYLKQNFEESPLKSFRDYYQQVIANLNPYAGKIYIGIKGGVTVSDNMDLSVKTPFYWLQSLFGGTDGLCISEQYDECSNNECAQIKKESAEDYFDRMTHFLAHEYKWDGNLEKALRTFLEQIVRCECTRGFVTIFRQFNISNEDLAMLPIPLCVYHDDVGIEYFFKSPEKIPVSLNLRDKRFTLLAVLLEKDNHCTAYVSFNNEWYYYDSCRKLKVLPAKVIKETFDYLVGLYFLDSG